MLSTVRRVATLTSLLLVTMLAVTPQARADIFDLNNAATCTGTAVVNGNTYGGNIGGGLCTSAEKAFQLSSLLTLLSNGTIVLGASGEGTDKFVVFDDIPNNAFSFTLTSTGQNNTGIANNAQCQINGGAAAFANACIVTDKNGQTTHLGAAQINNLAFATTISFSGPNLTGQTFNLEFVSMQGTSSVVSPEPSSLLLLASGFAASLGSLRKRPSHKG